MKETWKQIPGYEGKYFISNYGRVKRMFVMRNIGFNERETREIRKERILTPCDNGNGYQYVTLAHNGTKRHAYIHRLVAELFLREPESGEVVNHIDYDKRNNRVDNLEWRSQAENVRHSARHMMKPRYVQKNKTGEHHITRRGGLFRVCIRNSIVKTDKRFDTLEAAIAYRNEVLREDRSIS